MAPSFRMYAREAPRDGRAVPIGPGPAGRSRSGQITPSGPKTGPIRVPDRPASQVPRAPRAPDRSSRRLTGRVRQPRAHLYRDRAKFGPVQPGTNRLTLSAIGAIL